MVTVPVRDEGSRGTMALSDAALMTDLSRDALWGPVEHDCPRAPIQSGEGEPRRLRRFAIASVDTPLLVVLCGSLEHFPIESFRDIVG